MDWPLPKFYFSVHVGSYEQPVSFQEVSGLDTESHPVKYRQKDSKLFSTLKMPGIVKTGNVTLKKGTIAKGKGFMNWLEAIQLNTLKKETVTIRLLDEAGKTIMTWTLKNAFPTKFSISDLNATGNEVAIETLEIAHEGLTMENGV